MIHPGANETKRGAIIRATLAHAISRRHIPTKNYAQGGGKYKVPPIEFDPITLPPIASSSEALGIP